MSDSLHFLGTIKTFIEKTVKEYKGFTLSDLALRENDAEEFRIYELAVKNIKTLNELCAVLLQIAKEPTSLFYRILLFIQHCANEATLSEAGKVKWDMLITESPLLKQLIDHPIPANKQAHFARLFTDIEYGTSSLSPIMVITLIKEYRLIFDSNIILKNLKLSREHFIKMLNLFVRSVRELNDKILAFYVSLYHSEFDTLKNILESLSLDEKEIVLSSAPDSLLVDLKKIKGREEITSKTSQAKYYSFQEHLESKDYPLQIAVRYLRSAKITQLLLDYGASVKDDNTQNILQDVMAFAPTDETVDVLKVLLQHPDIEVNNMHSISDKHENHMASSLMLSAQMKYSRYIELLLNHDKIDVNVGGIRDLIELTPLHVAVAQKNLALIKTLLLKGANANLKDFNNVMLRKHILKTSLRNDPEVLAKLEKPNTRKAATHPTIKPARKEDITRVLSEDENQLKKILLRSTNNYSYYEPDELTPPGFSIITQDNKLHLTISAATNQDVERIKRDLVDQLRIKQSPETENLVNCITVIGELSDLRSFIESTFDKTKMALTMLLQQLGFKELHQTVGFEITVNQNKAAIYFYGYVDTILNKIAKAAKMHNGVNENRNPTRGKLSIVGSAGGLKDFLENKGEKFIINPEDNQLNAPKKRSKRKKKSVTIPQSSLIQLDSTVWDGLIRESFANVEGLTLDYQKVPTSLKPSVTITIPRLNNYWKIATKDNNHETVLMTKQLFEKTIFSHLRLALPKAQIILTSENSIVITPSTSSPPSEFSPLQECLDKILTANNDKKSLLEQAFDLQNYRIFFRSTFAAEDGLNVRLEDKNNLVTLHVTHSPTNTSWTITDGADQKYSVYVSEATFQNKIMKRLVSEFESDIISHSDGHLSIRLHREKLIFKSDEIHHSVCKTLIEDHIRREQSILNVGRLTMNFFSTTHRQPPSNLSDVKNNEEDNNNPDMPYQSDKKPSKLFIDLLHKLLNSSREDKKEWFTLEANQITVMAHINTFGCLNIEVVLNLLLSSLRAHLPAEISLGLANSNEKLIITGSKEFATILLHLTPQEENLKTYFQSQLTKELEGFITEHINNFVYDETELLLNTQECDSFQEKKKENFFVGFYHVASQLNEKDRVRLSALKSALEQVNEISNAKDQAYLHQIIRLDLARFFALLHFVARGNSHISLVRHYVRHNITDRQQQDFRNKCNSLIDIIMEFIQAEITDQLLSCYFFQKLYDNYAQKLFESLIDFSNLNQKSQSFLRWKRREKHQYLQNLLENIDKTTLSDEQKRKAIVSFLCDIGESTSDKLIQNSADKLFFALCKEAYQNVGHNFDLSETELVELYAKKYTDYLATKQKIPSTLRADAPVFVPRSKMRADVKPFEPRQFFFYKAENNASSSITNPNASPGMISPQGKQ